MKTVLAFGDSLTWGADPETGFRHAHDDRWPSVLEQVLGGAARVVAEGLCGRTTSFDDHASSVDLNGANALPMLLATHLPLDAVVIMLGTNDLKPQLCGVALGAAFGMRRLTEIVATHPIPAGMRRPDVLLVSPPVITEPEQKVVLSSFGGAGSDSRKLSVLYQQVAIEAGCAFFDAGTVANTSPADGVHLDVGNTRAIGRALAPVVRAMLDARQ